jgi:UDP-N-acetylglucosamine 2-epimerase (hydrolysing)
LVGNSSAGVREAPFLGIPSINIGTRQNNRGRSPSIIHASAFETDKLKEVILRNWGKNHIGCTQYGSGNSINNFVNLLRSDRFWNYDPQKKFFCGN